MDGFSVIELLDADPRPTLVLDLNSDFSTAPSPLCFCNEVLRCNTNLVNSLISGDHHSALFRAWMQDLGGNAETKGATYTFGGQLWTALTIRRRWRIISGTAGTLSQPCWDVKVITPPLFEREIKRQDSGNGGSDPTQTLKSDVLAGGNEEATATSSFDRFEDVMEMSNVGIAEFDTEGKLLFANHAWSNSSGAQKERKPAVEVLARASASYFRDFVHDEDAATVFSGWGKLKAGRPTAFEMRWKKPCKVRHDKRTDPLENWVLVACLPVFDDDGVMTSVAVCTTDISAHKRSEQDVLQRTRSLDRATASNRMFSRFAEVAPVAMFMFDSQMDMQYCNDKFFEITGHPRVIFHDIDWRNVILKEDVQRCELAWEVLLIDKIPINTEFRLRDVPKTTIDDEEIPSWVMCKSYPELNADGSINTIMGTLYDISHLKWAESVQKRRVEEAMEAKRRQSNFQDIFAHEMRNPLGAVLQCADSAVTSLEEMAVLAGSVLQATQHGQSQRLQTAIESSLDAVRTIISCSMHQKRMCTDILTLSKFDSRLLLVTPVRVQPEVVVQEALKIVKSESQKVSVEFKFETHSSMRELGVDWIMLDPSRMMQILVNLFTNAMKFAKNEAMRIVTVTLGAEVQRPPESGHWGGVCFDPTTKGIEDTVDRPEWGNGQKMHLWVTVRDTGCGMNATEQARLFQRFSQASAYTHIQHGGSGLGLFISKVLTELQGGQMGVSSEAGVGSVFAFFVQTRAAPSIPSSPFVDADATIHGAELKLLQVAASQLTILVVEDNPVNSKVLCTQLQKLGCSVHVAGHGGEALEFLTKTKYWKGQAATGEKLSLIMMDIDMPIMDGLTCARRIRELQRTGYISAHIPILAVSGNAGTEDAEEAMDAGMDDALAKPFRIPELLLKIVRLALHTQ